MLKTSFIYWLNILFLIFSLFLVNGPQALYINPDCLKCILDINLPPDNKKIFTISYIIYLVLTC